VPTLRAFASEVAGISPPKQAAVVFSGFNEHAIPARIGSAIRHAMLNDVDTRPQLASDGLAPCLLDDFVDREIDSGRVRAVKQCRGYPNFVGDPNICGLSGKQTPP
jgi:hypothetical protein